MLNNQNTITFIVWNNNGKSKNLIFFSTRFGDIFFHIRFFFHKYLKRHTNFNNNPLYNIYS